MMTTMATTTTTAVTTTATTATTTAIAPPIRSSVTADMDEVRKRYDLDVRLHLARRCLMKRERILRFIEEYARDIVNSDAYRLTGCPFVDKDVYALLMRRRELRERLQIDGQSDDRAAVVRIAKRLNVEQLNLLLYNLEELYRDIVELIDMNEKSGIAVKTPPEQTFDILTSVLVNLLNDGERE